MCTGLKRATFEGKIQEIDDFAFAGCENLEEITLAPGLRRVGQYAFSGCTALTRIDIPTTTRVVDTGAFMGCVNLTVNVCTGRASMAPVFTKYAEHAFENTADVTYNEC